MYHKIEYRRLRQKRKILGRTRSKITVQVEELDVTFEMIAELEERVKALETENTHLSLIGAGSIQFYLDWQSVSKSKSGPLYAK